MTFLLSPHLQLDLSGGISWQDRETNYFLSTGFSFRLQRGDKHI
jgi:hypothetical protein